MVDKPRVPIARFMVDVARDALDDGMSMLRNVEDSPELNSVLRSLALVKGSLDVVVMEFLEGGAVRSDDLPF